MIRSLKKALQPAVTETEVKFSLPGDFTIQVAPENVPRIFVGERAMVFGILTHSSTKELPKLTQGSVYLSGNLLGAKIEHELKLEISTTVAKDEQQVTTIHHLAGKRLIKEMESSVDKDEQRQAIIKLSLDSNVISSLTGFIAIDKETKEPVKGSMQTWDVMSPIEGNLFMGMLCSAAPIDRCSAPARARLHRRSRDLPVSKLLGGILLKKSKPAATRSACIAPRVRAMPRSGSDFNKYEHMKQTLENAKSNDKSVIDLQLASGAWSLSSELAAFIGMKKDDIKASCPVPCQGNMEIIWATIIALVYLENKQSDLKDEWELVAAKAQSWIAKQSLPEGCSIEILHEKAVKVVS